MRYFGLVFLSCCAWFLQIQKAYAETEILAFSCFSESEVKNHTILLEDSQQGVRLISTPSLGALSAKEISQQVYEFRFKNPGLTGYLRKVDGAWKFLSSDAGLVTTYSCNNFSDPLASLVEYYATSLSKNAGNLGMLSGTASLNAIGAQEFVDKLVSENTSLIVQNSKIQSSLESKTQQYAALKSYAEKSLSDLVAASNEQIAKLKADHDTKLSQMEAKLRVALARAAAQEHQRRKFEKELHDSDAKRETLLNQQVSMLRNELGKLQELLALAEQKDADSQIKLQNLGNRLNAALARAASEERKRRKLEEAERIRLEAEAKKLKAKRDKLVNQALDLASYKSEFFDRLRDILAGQEGVKIVDDRFVFSSEVLFDPGAANLSEAGQFEIDKVANILLGVKDSIPDNIEWVIRVDGHTDNIPLSGLGEFRDNWELSQARALSVVRYMVEVLQFPANRMAANGFGEFQPVSTDDTSKARAQNRRIEIKLTER